MKTLFWCVVASGLLMVPPANAQDNATNGASAEAAGRTTWIEDVVVRARKRQETQQTAPVTMSVLSGTKLDRQFATTLADIRTVPNINLQHVSQFRNALVATIRGIGYGGINSEIDPEVAIYVDGVYFTRNTTAVLDVFDLESIEVLRGPQGTLLGRNTLAGAITVRSKRPTGEFGAEGQLRVGSFGRIDFRGATNFSIVEDKVAARIAVMSRNSNGIYRNAVDDNKRFGSDDIIAIRPSVKFTPNDDFEWTIIGEYSRDRSDPQPNKNASAPGSLFCVLAGTVGDTNCGNNPWSYIHPSRPEYIPGNEKNNSLGDPHLIAFNNDTENKSDTWGLISEAVLRTSAGTFTSITSYRKVDERYLVDSEGDVIKFFNADRPAKVEDFTQELRHEITVGDFDVITGLFYLHSKIDTAMTVTSIFGFFENFRQSIQSRDNFAAFVDLQYHISDDLTFETGARYSHEKKKFAFGAALPLGIPLTLQDLDEKWSNVSPHAVFSYTISEEVMAYAKWARAFKSGGFNSLVATAADAGPYDPEKVDGFEIGLKGDFMDNRLRINVAAFWQLFKDLQRQVVLVTGTTTSNLIVNAADATTRGVEIEVTAVPVDNLNLNVTLGYLDASYSDFCSDIGVVNLPPSTAICDTANLNFRDLSALDLTLAPEIQLSIGALYTVELGNGGTLDFQADYNYSSSLETETGNSAIGHRRATHVVNASIVWEHPTSNYGVSFFVHNLFDTVYTQSGLDVGGGVWSLWVPNAPRTFGVNINFKLGEDG